MACIRVVGSFAGSSFCLSFRGSIYGNLNGFGTFLPLDGGGSISVWYREHITTIERPTFNTAYIGVFAIWHLDDR